MHRELNVPSGLALAEPNPVAEETQIAVAGIGRIPATPSLRVAIAAVDPVGCSTLRHMLVQTGLTKSIEEWALSNPPEMRNSQDVPDVVFVDLSPNNKMDFSLAQQLNRMRPSTHIVACSASRESNPEFLLQAMRSGVRDFLERPYDRGEVTSLMARVNQAQRKETIRPATTGKLFVVLGTKGGVGTSTVSVNLALQLASIPGKSTVLLDFSRPLGDVSAFLDLTPSFQMRDAVENFSRMDPTLFAGLLTQHKSGLRVLTGAAQLEDWEHASIEAIERVVEIAQQTCDFVVMDFGAFYSAKWQRVLQAAEILLVSEADLAGLAKLNRHLGALAKMQVSSHQTKLIINRWHRPDEAALEKVENAVRMKVFARLPNNFKQVNEAAVRGDSLGQSGDPLSTEFKRMAAKLAGLESPLPGKRSRMAQFFSL
jgi:pilus assembly protein CpaE